MGTHTSSLNRGTFAWRAKCNRSTSHIWEGNAKESSSGTSRGQPLPRSLGRRRQAGPTPGGGAAAEELQGAAGGLEGELAALSPPRFSEGLAGRAPASAVSLRRPLPARLRSAPAAGEACLPGLLPHRPRRQGCIWGPEAKG